MRPTHAQKGARRYRYYVSPALIESSVETGASGWRVPAAEIEQVVGQAIRATLRDPARRSAIIAAVEEPARVASTLDRLDGLTAALQDPTGAEGRTALGRIVRRVDLTETALEAALEAAINLSEILGLEDAPGKIPHSSITVSAPIRVDRRGASVRLVLQGAAAEPAAPDPQLVRTVIAARRRLAAYTSPSSQKSIVETAADEAADPADISRSLQLAFLAPALLEAILDGRQPIGLTATRLQRLDTLPLLWDAQRAALS